MNFLYKKKPDIKNIEYSASRISGETLCTCKIAYLISTGNSLNAVSALGGGLGIFSCQPEYDSIILYSLIIGKPQKSFFFLNGSAIKALPPPPPSSLLAVGTLMLKKKF